MVLSKREKYCAVFAVILVAVLVLDRFALTPFLETRKQTRTQKLQLQDKLTRAESLLRRRKALDNKWQEMVRQGVSNNTSETESQVLHEVRNWSREYGLNLSSIKPDYVKGEESQNESAFLVSGTGNMSSLGQFLYQVEITPLPLRLKDIQISSRQEAADDMSLQVRLSAMHFPTEIKASAPQAGMTSAGGSKQ